MPTPLIPDTSAPLFEVRLDNGGGCRLWGDGTFETFGAYTPDDAAQKFWASIAEMLPPEFRRSAEELAPIKRKRMM